MISVAAPAKLNLHLHVTGKRADGYHLLESLVVFTHFGDRLDIEPAAGLSLDIAGPFAAGLSTEDNLVLKAARLLQSSLPHKPGAHIRLAKNIPVGAGLGGGSSDAAAALKALATLWDIPREKLPALALRLGSDVPACLAAHPLWMSGTGDILTPVSFAFDMWLLLVNPHIPLPTSDVFRRYAPPFSVPETPPSSFASFDVLLSYLKPRRNDLEAPATALQPAIGAMLRALEQAPGCRLARMSGSGATCFGLFASEKGAIEAQNLLAQTRPDWWYALTSLQNGSHGQTQ